MKEHLTNTFIYDNSTDTLHTLEERVTEKEMNNYG